MSTGSAWFVVVARWGIIVVLMSRSISPTCAEGLDSWTNRALQGVHKQWMAIEAGNDFLLSRSDDSWSGVSTAGANWTFVNSPLQCCWGWVTDLAFGQGIFVAVGGITFPDLTRGGPEIWASTNGIDWRRLFVGGPREALYNSVAFGSGTFDGSFFAVGDDVILESEKISPLHLSARSEENAHVRLTVTFEPRTNVRLQVSDDLIDWQDWNSITSDTGMAELVDQKTYERKFYPAVSP